MKNQNKKENVLTFKSKHTFGKAHVKSNIIGLSDDLNWLCVHNTHDVIHVRDLNNTDTTATSQQNIPLIIMPPLPPLPIHHPSPCTHIHQVNYITLSSHIHTHRVNQLVSQSLA